MKRVIKYLKHQMQKETPIYWDRLMLVVFGNIMLAMSLIVLIEDKSIMGAMFCLSIGVIWHWLFWTGRRIKIEIE